MGFPAVNSLRLIDSDSDSDLESCGFSESNLDGESQSCGYPESSSDEESCGSSGYNSENDIKGPPASLADHESFDDERFHLPDSRDIPSSNSSIGDFPNQITSDTDFSGVTMHRFSEFDVEKRIAGSGSEIDSDEDRFGSSGYNSKEDSGFKFSESESDECFDEKHKYDSDEQSNGWSVVGSEDGSDSWSVVESDNGSETCLDKVDIDSY